MDAEPTTPSGWEALLEKPQSRREWHTDAEVCEAAGITQRTLQMLQTLKVVSATKSPRVNGGFMRVWQRHELYIAATAGKAASLLGWSVMKTAMVMRLVFPVRLDANYRKLFINDALDTDCVEHNEPGSNTVVAQPLDWAVSIYDSRFVFLTIPSDNTRKAVSAFHETFALGVVFDDISVPIPFQFEDPRLSGALKGKLGPEFSKSLLDIQSLRRAKASALTSIKINIAMPVRAEAIRLDGGDPMYAGDVILKDLGDDWQERFGIKE